MYTTANFLESKGIRNFVYPFLYVRIFHTYKQEKRNLCVQYHPLTIRYNIP